MSSMTSPVLGSTNGLKSPTIISDHLRPAALEAFSTDAGSEASKSNVTEKAGATGGGDAG